MPTPTNGGPLPTQGDIMTLTYSTKTFPHTNMQVLRAMWMCQNQHYVGMAFDGHDAIPRSHPDLQASTLLQNLVMRGKSPSQETYIRFPATSMGQCNAESP